MVAYMLLPAVCPTTLTPARTAASIIFRIPARSSLKSDVYAVGNDRIGPSIRCLRSAGVVSFRVCAAGDRSGPSDRAPSAVALWRNLLRVVRLVAVFMTVAPFGKNARDVWVESPVDDTPKRRCEGIAWCATLFPSLRREKVSQESVWR